MPLSLSAAALLVIAPLWAAAGFRARQQAERERSERAAEAEAEAAVDELVTALAWAFEIEVERAGEGGSEPGAITVRGRSDGQRFELSLAPTGWTIAVDVQPVLPAGVEIRAIDAGPLLCATSEAEGERRGLGHPGFDARYFVVPPERGDRIPPALVELLGRRAISELRLSGDRLRIDACGRSPIEGRAALLASLREALTLARELEAHASRRPLVRGRSP